VLCELIAGGACLMPGSTPLGGWITPPERSSFSLSGSVELPLVAGSSGIFPCDGLSAVGLAFDDDTGAAVAGAAPAISAAIAA
jgi:hypothetical protein